MIQDIHMILTFHIYKNTLIYKYVSKQDMVPVYKDKLEDSGNVSREFETERKCVGVKNTI